MEHHLKTPPQWFDAVASGAKTVELRREDDRRFEPGDVLVLHEWHTIYNDGDNAFLWYSYSRYTGRTCRVRVTHVSCHEDVPDLLPPGVAALSIRREEDHGDAD